MQAIVIILILIELRKIANIERDSVLLVSQNLENVGQLVLL